MVVQAGENIDIGIDIGKKVKYRVNILSKEKGGIAHPYNELITYSFVLYLQHGRHDVIAKPSITYINETRKRLASIMKNPLSFLDLNQT